TIATSTIAATTTTGARQLNFKTERTNWRRKAAPARGQNRSNQGNRAGLTRTVLGDDADAGRTVTAVHATRCSIATTTASTVITSVKPCLLSTTNTSTPKWASTAWKTPSTSRKARGISAADTSITSRSNIANGANC